MRLRVALVMLACAGLLCSCDWAKDMSGRVNPDTLSLADRCANFMKAAMPGAEIDFGKRTSENTGVRTLTARVEGTRTDGPKDAPIERDLAAECQFDNNLLTGFQWTKGGPPVPASNPPSDSSR